MQTEYLIPFADEHYDVDPPSREVIEFDVEIDRLIFGFWKVTLPHVDVTFELPLALGSLRKFRPAFQLDGERRDKLINAIAGAAAAIVQKLPDIYNPGMVAMCIIAATVIVRDWADDEQERAAHHPHRLVDAKLYVRMLERDLRNISDFAWLQQRKAQRQREIVRSLLAPPDSLGAEKVAA